MWLRIVRARRSASTSARTTSPTAQRAVQRAAMDDQAADGPLRVVDREERPRRRPVADHALVADLAAALGVERRPVQHELGLGAGRGAQLDLRHAASSSYSMPSRRMATTWPSAVVVS